MTSRFSRLLPILFLACSLCVAQSETTPDAKRSAAPANKKKTATKKKAPSSAASSKKRKRKAVITPRVRRIRRAFVASADLKPMAVQLLENRTPQAYAGVEKYARSHQGDASGLAWLAIGYARSLDQQYPQAIDALKRARPKAGEVGDYVDFYLGQAYVALGQQEEAKEALKDFDTRHPNSILSREALAAYANALITTGESKRAVELLEARRKPPRADFELALGRAYIAEGQTTKAAVILRNVYFKMPTSAQADLAKSALESIATTAALPPPSLAERKTRAELLLQGRRFADAAQDYRALAQDAPAADAASFNAALGYALFRSGREREAQDLLQNVQGASEEANGQRLYALLEIARPDQKRVNEYLDQLRRQSPNSSWFDDALLSAANMYLLDRNYEQAATLYSEIDERFPGSSYAPYAHWRAAWLTYMLGRKDEAKYRFEEQVSLFPKSQEVTAALYWRGRIAEEEKDWGKARAYYQKLIERYRSYYYAELARERLALFQPGPAVPDATLERVPQLSAKAIEEELTPPEDSLRAQKALLLGNGGLTELAIRELQGVDGADWALAEIAKIYQENGQYHRALQALKRAYPAYFALDTPSLPRDFWETLFPRPFWDDLKRYSNENGVDPYMVASLVRQESEFNPGAVSRANAVGLMQLLPGVGKKLAREVKLKGFNTAMLFTPSVNLRLGTRYFKRMLDKYDGTVEYALAAYNAGSDRVADWRDHNHFRDVPEFVESIPFTETREYVQAIVRNAAVYRRLYGTPVQAAAQQ